MTEPSKPSALRNLSTHAGVAIALVGLTVVFYWSAASHLGTWFVADGHDGANFIWVYRHFADSLAAGNNPFLTDKIFYPVGIDLGFHTTTPMWAVIAWPLSELFGFLPAVNLINLLAIPLSGYGAYLLALHQWKNRSAAFFTAVVFAFLPYRFLRPFAHWNLNHTEVISFGLLALVMVYEKPTRGRSFFFGAMMAAAVLTELTYALFLLIAALVIAIWRWRETLTKRLALAIVGSALVAVVLSFPYLLVLSNSLMAGELDPLPGWGGAPLLSADVLSWFVPQPHHRIWGSNSQLAQRISLGERTVFSGITTYVLAGIALWIGRERHRWSWLALAVVFGLLSLGPFLQVNGRKGELFTYNETEFSVPLPYFVLHQIPLANAARNPGRFGLVASLAVAVLAAGGLAKLMESRRRIGAGVALVATLLLLWEFFPPRPLPRMYPNVPEPYRAIAAHPDTSAVLEVPIWWSANGGFTDIGDKTGRNNSIYLYYATKHHRPLVGGVASRYPRRRIEQLKSVWVYTQFLSMQGEPGYKDPPTLVAEDLRNARIGFVVYHRDRPFLGVHEYLSTLNLPVLADDGTTLVWKVPEPD